MVSEGLDFWVLLNSKCKQVQLALACMYYSEAHLKIKVVSTF